MIVKNLSRTYTLKDSPSVQALRGVSFTLADTGMVFFLGKSGSGKSTLLNVLSGLDKADEGSHVEIYGKNICALSISELDDYRNSCCGFVFQEYNLIPELNVQENIALAIELQGENDIEDKVKDALKKVELDGYEKRKVTELSGGQKQRIAIARALIKNPDIIFADEPTGALDKSTGESIMELLKELSKEKLVVVVSHDNDYAARYADRIIELEDGKIINDSAASTTMYPTESNSSKEWHKSRLPIKSALKIGCGSFKIHPIRLAVTLLLAILAFTIFCVSLTISLNQYSDVVFDAISANGLKYSTIYKYDDDNNRFLIKESDKVNIDNTLGYSSIGAISFPMEFDIEMDEDSPSIYYSYLPNKLCELSQETITRYDFTVYGELPHNKNEIGITRYTAEVLNHIKYFEPSELDLIGKTIIIDGNECLITSIIDTRLDSSKYSSLKNAQTGANISLENEFVYEMNTSAHNLLIIDNIDNYKTTAISTNPIFCSIKYNHSQVMVVENIHPYKDVENLLKVNDAGKGVYVPAYLISTLLGSYGCAIEFEGITHLNFGTLFNALYRHEIEKDHLDAEKAIAVYDKYKDVYKFPNDFACSYSDAKFELDYSFAVLGFHSLDDYETILVDDSTYESIYERIGGDFDSLIAINDKSIKKYIAQNTHFRAYNYIIYLANSASDFVNSIKRIAYIVFGVFAAFSICLLLNFLSQSLLDRTKAIGILKANGSNNFNLIKIFIWESLIVGLVVLVGISIFSPIVCEILNSFAVTTIGTNYLQFFNFNAYAYIISAASIVLFSLLGNLIPLLKLSRLMPSDYLQME